MDLLKLADEIITGKRLTKNDDLSFFITCDLTELRMGADKIRQHFSGDKIDLCTIINGKSGKCSENCKYCSQSAHNHSNCEIYDFISQEKIVSACTESSEQGAHRFSIVTSGKTVSDEEFQKVVDAFEAIKKECDIQLCASLGFLTQKQLNKLKELGLTHYHQNIETSRRYFPSICTTHTFDMKLESINMIKKAGLKVCSGGILGMGETWEDRLDMALTLSEIGIDSIALNALMPVPGTPFENQRKLTEEEMLRSIAFFKYINPESDIRVAAGRILFENDGINAFSSGASATVTGNMLTTAAKATIKSDIEMFKSMGREV